MKTVELTNEGSEPLSIAHTDTRTRRIWDLPVRIFHWTLVLSFIGAYVTNRAGIEYFQYHLWFGYSVVVLVSFRILWGFIGTRHARFWNFLRGPLHTLRYAASLPRREPVHYAGHNPLGALMVLALLASLLVQGLAGLFANDEIFNTGPLYAWISEDLSLQLTSLHRQLFYWILAAVGLHVVAVLVHVFFKKENLVKAMITGRKPASTIASADEIPSSRTWLAVLIVLALAGGLGWIVEQAPQAESSEY